MYIARVYNITNLVDHVIKSFIIIYIIVNLINDN